MTAREIRRQFLDFFAKRAHVIVPSDSVVPSDDPTLLFVNAGMNQFKDVFLGMGSRPYQRAANVQKCIRAGGKHNDLDEVGTDTYHHTFFEMLGSWSFGDYFKREIIPWSWELLTEVYGISKDRLHVTYLEGSPAENLETDLEVKALWRELTDIDPTHIHPGKKDDNFWEMGDTGPCGPCSEIHVDLTPDKSGGRLVNAGNPLVMELWNLVFIQFNRNEKGMLTPLPAKHVDTGMGFDRLVAILQGKPSSYDTDLLQPIIRQLEQQTQAGTYQGATPSAHPTEPEMRDVAYRVLADHLRCLAVAITDGVVPSNEGRGYVIRRILRRAYTYGYRHLGVTKPFIHQHIPLVVELMRENYPELQTNCDRVVEIIREEEEAFDRTLAHGLKLFSTAAARATSAGGNRISGEDAFKLHDTYGFPIDLTRLMADEQRLTVDADEFERIMDAARKRARGEDKPESLDAIDGLQLAVASRLTPELQQRCQTNDRRRWEAMECTSEIMGWFDAEGTLHETSLSPSPGTERVPRAVLLRETCFYGEQGGQVGDTGTLTTADGGLFQVLDTRKLQGVVLHIGHLQAGRLEPGQAVRCAVTATRRQRVRQNHTATHLLNLALRQVLGDHVKQEGSLVDVEKTRFDFSHKGPLSGQEVAQIESQVNVNIENDLTVYDGEVDQKEALKIEGIRAVFDERYSDVVRVISIGVPIEKLQVNPASKGWRSYSVELCGGTHVQHTKLIGRFVLVADEAVGRGVRRLVGLSGEAATAATSLGNQLRNVADGLGRRDIEECAEELETLKQRLTQAVIPLRDRTEVAKRIAIQHERLKTRDKQQSKEVAKLVLAQAAELMESAVDVNGTSVIVGQLPAASADQLRKAIDWLRQKLNSSAVVLLAHDDAKVTLLAGMSRDVVDKGVKANELVKEISPVISGSGGGRPDMAQGGGTDLDAVPKAIQAANEWLHQRL